MQIIVTTHRTGEHLLFEGLELTKKFLGIRPRVDLSPSGETKAQQLLRIVSNYADEYFILMEEDFYLIKPVDVELLETIYNYCKTVDVDRFSLQSRSCYSSSNWEEMGNYVEGTTVYKAAMDVRSRFGLDASIWRREFLREWLVWFLANHSNTSQDDGQMENKISSHLTAESIPTKIYTLHEIVMHYRDMMRGGQEEIKLLHDPLRMVVEPGKELALHPQGDSQELELLL